MKLQHTLTNVIKEEINADLPNKLRDLASKFGLQRVYDMVGGSKNYLKLVYDGNLKEFYKEEEIEPFRVTQTSTPAMYIDNLLVDELNLENYGTKEKKLGQFKYGNTDNMRYLVDARLYKVVLGDGSVGWKVVAIGGSRGFGYSFISTRDILGSKYRKQIFNQIIQKYNLKDYL